MKKKDLLFIGLAVMAVFFISACAESENSASTGGVLMKLSSTFVTGEQLPTEFTCDGNGVSPPLLVDNVPNNAQSLVLIVEDPDAPAGTFTHWIMWNISPQTSQIPKGRSAGVEGTNDFGKKGYGAPCPPSGIHKYIFRLYALRKTLDLPDTTTRKELDKAMAGHILAQTSLTSVYSSS